MEGEGALEGVVAALLGREGEGDFALEVGGVVLVGFASESEKLIFFEIHEQKYLRKIKVKEDVGLAYVIEKYDIRGVLVMII